MCTITRACLCVLLSCAASQPVGSSQQACRGAAPFLRISSGLSGDHTLRASYRVPNGVTVIVCRMCAENTVPATVHVGE